MGELDARYARGQDTRRMFGGGTITSAGSVPGAWDVAPDLERILGEALFGTIWRRDALSPVQREMITLSTLLVLTREPQLRRHLGNALHIGLTPEQIVELILHDTWYGGAPAGLSALALCKAVFEERGIAFTPPRVHDTTEAPDRLFERGAQLRRQYMGTPSTIRPAPPTEAERAFHRITDEYYWGATWTRPGLDLPSRCLCTMTCLAALAREGPLCSHIRGALHLGFTQEQIIEVFLHLTLYGGIAFARGASTLPTRCLCMGRLSVIAVRTTPCHRGTSAARAYRGGAAVGQARPTAQLVDDGGTVVPRAPGWWTCSPGSQACGAFLRGG